MAGHVLVPLAKPFEAHQELVRIRTRHLSIQTPFVKKVPTVHQVRAWADTYHQGDVQQKVDMLMLSCTQNPGLVFAAVNQMKASISIIA